MTQRIIAIDIDDVVADSTECLRVFVNTQHGVDLTTEQYRIPGAHRRYYEKVWKLNDIDDSVTFADFEAEMIRDQSDVAVIKDADHVIRRLKDKFHIIFITARPDSWDEATRIWFKRYFDSDIELYFSQGYHSDTGKTKGQLCKELGAEWLIDDVPGNCQTALDEDINVILFGDYGWNRDAQMMDSMRWMKDWRSIEEHFSEC